LNTLNITQLREAIETAFYTDIPLMIWGPPGSGKTSAVENVAQQLQVPLKDIRLSQIESIDLRGVPTIIDGKTVWMTPSFFPRDPDSVGIIMFDEIPDGDPSTQAACYQFINERRLGEYELPAGWRILGAGNPNNGMLTEALNNRLTHVTVEPDIADWASWALENNIHKDIIAFLMARPSLLSCMPTHQDENAYPTPRTWEMASRYHSMQPQSAVYRQLMEGAVGKGAIIEFFAYMNMKDKLPTIDELLANPTGFAEYNSSPSKIAALCLMVVANIERATVDPLMQFLKTVTVDFQVMAITIIDQNKNYLMGTKPITEWLSKNANSMG